jgi:hypothetical protein
VKLPFFGRGAPKDLLLVPFAESTKRRLTSLCDGVIAENVPDFATLRVIHTRLQAERPAMRVLATLDDPDQAGYTSYHAIDTHDLNRTEGHDLSALSPECFDGGEHLGYFTTPDEFPFQLANLRALTTDMTLADARGVLFWQGGAVDGPTFPDTVMHDPDAALGVKRLREVQFLFVPVTSAADALAAFPNGYFSADLNPLQNHALARHLEERYGLALMGVGASYLGFVRDGPLSPDEAAALAEDLVSLHAEAPPFAAERLAGALAGKDWLLLRYTES